MYVFEIKIGTQMILKQRRKIFIHISNKNCRNIITNSITQQHDWYILYTVERKNMRRIYISFVSLVSWVLRSMQPQSEQISNAKCSLCIPLAECLVWTFLCKLIALFSFISLISFHRSLYFSLANHAAQATLISYDSLLFSLVSLAVYLLMMA